MAEVFSPPGRKLIVESPPGTLALPPSSSTESTKDRSTLRAYLHRIRTHYPFVDQKLQEARQKWVYGTSHFALLSGDAAMQVAKSVGSILQKEVPPNPDSYANNELCVQIDAQEIATKDVYIIQSTNGNPDTALSQLKLLMEGAKGAGANRTTAIVLHLPYSRQDRRAKPGQPEAARMKELEIYRSGSHNPDKKAWKHETPLTAKANLIVVDVHSTKPLETITADSGYQWANLDPAFVLKPKVRKIIEDNNLDVAIAFPDKTAAVRYASYAQEFGGGIEKAAIIKKKRDLDHHNTVAISEDQESLSGKVAGKDVIMIDDIADTLGTALQAAKRLKEDGARSVRLLATHGIFSAEARQRIDDSAFDGIIVTDTIEQHFEHPKLEVVSIAPLIAETIQTIENRQCLGHLASATSLDFDKSYQTMKSNRERRKVKREENPRKLARIARELFYSRRKPATHQ